MATYRIFLAKRDIIGTNAGNLLYLYSVCRSIYSDDALYDVDGYRVESRKYSDKKIDEIRTLKSLRMK